MPLRLLGVILLVIGTSLGLVGPAVAAPYGPRTGAATVSSTRVVQHDLVRVSGDGFLANTSVDVTVTQGGEIVRARTVRASSAGVATRTLKLSELGRNTIKLSGFHAVGETLDLSAKVMVTPHQGKAHASHGKVNKGDRVDVWGSGSCRNARVLVRTYDDGRLYKTKTIHANRSGNAKTSVTLTRAGRTTLTFRSCRKNGGTVLKTTQVTVRNARSFRSSPMAYAGDMAGSVSPAGYVMAGGALLLLFGGAQVMFARRRRSS